MKLRGKEASGLKRMVGDWAKRQALLHHEAEMAGEVHSSLGYTIARKMILSKVHEALGLDRAVSQGFAIGGSAVSPDTVKYFLSLDIKLLELIAATETCGMIQIGNRTEPGNFRVGKVGKVYNDELEVKLKSMDNSGNGEMLSRGRSICMGYLNNREKTLEAIDDDGWLHSGDLVSKDKEDFYTVVGRIKEILITSGGKNISPSNIEEVIKTELPDIISNVMLVGDGKPYLCCLLTLRVELDPKTLAPTNMISKEALKWIKGVTGSDSPVTTQDLLKSEVWQLVHAEINIGIERANKKAESQAAWVRKWRLIPIEFSVDGGELSPSLKLKRFHITEVYKDVID